MAFIAAAIGGAALAGLAGSVISSNAAGNAANTQANAANNASQLQWNEFQQQQANQAPWLQGGGEGLNQLEWELGLSPTGMPSGSSGTLSPTPQQQSLMNSPFMIGKPAASPQVSVMGGGAPQQSFTPSGEFGALNKQFTMQDFQQDPGYQFQMDQGLQAVQRSAAAKGFLNSTGTMQDINNYAQGVANQQYGNAYNRFITNQTNQYNRLASLAGVGQTAANNVGQMGMNTANNMAGNMMSAGAAQAAGQVGSANAYSGALNGVANNYMNYSMMNKYLGQNPTSYDANAGGGAFGMPAMGDLSTYGSGGTTMGTLNSTGGYLGMNSTMPILD